MPPPSFARHPPLVDRILRGESLAAARARGEGLAKVRIDRSQVLDTEKIANGTFSPIDGFLGGADYRSVVDTMRLVDGTPWPIPVTLQLPENVAASCRPGADVLLWNDEEDRPSAILSVSDVYRFDIEEQARKVYGTNDRRHPGVARMASAGDLAVGGRVSLVGHAESLIPKAFDLDPATVRAEIDRRGFRTITGFQTRNLGHRAHERLQKMGLELTDGLLVHPLIGWKKNGDMLPEVILEGYALLIERYYPKDRVILAGLTTAMRYAGPREAVFHAIIRRNFGCTHFIVGRDHAGVGGFYEKYAGHRIFDAFGPGELGIAPLLLHGPCHCTICDEIVTERSCPHGESAWVDISGTEVRALIARGERPSRALMRPEIADFLIERARKGPVFFDDGKNA